MLFKALIAVYFENLRQYIYNYTVVRLQSIFILKQMLKIILIFYKWLRTFTVIGGIECDTAPF
jgi:hypothetical protein